MSPLQLSARDFQRRAHARVGQVRKYTGEPYSVHPSMVAAYVAECTDEPEALAAAELHDVVEDCGVRLEEIGFAFGPRVAEYVDYLTAPDDPRLNRAARKQLELRKLAVAPDVVHTIKLADMLDNGPSIELHDPNFAKLWFKEAADRLTVLDRGDPGLYRLVGNVVKGYFARNARGAMIRAI